MANVANTKSTGPASKDTVSGGKKLPLQTTDANMSGHSLAGLSTSSEEARRSIMGMRVQSTPYMSTDAQGQLKGVRTIGIPDTGIKPT